MKESIKQTFFELNRLVGVTGAEQDVIRYCKSMAEPYADRVEVMPSGNLIATFTSDTPGPIAMFSAHTDEVGFIIKYISSDGFLFFERVGGVPLKTMPARRLLIQGDKGLISGVIGLSPGHIETSQEAMAVATSKQSYIDVGAFSSEEVAEMGIRVGCRAVADSSSCEMANKDLITGRCADNRINCAVLLILCKNMKQLNFAGTIHIVFSVLEETSIIGAAQVSNYLHPDYCIVLDTIPAGDTPNVGAPRLPVSIGKGPTISFADCIPGALIATYPHPRLIEAVQMIAEQKKISMQYLTISEDVYLTDSAGISQFGSHAPGMTIATPRRYSHSPVELFDIKDSVKVYDLVTGLVENNGGMKLNFI